MRVTRRFIPATGLVLAISWGCLDPGVAARTQTPTTIPPPNGRALTPSLAAALHVHGWSNHAGGPRPGSIAWQTQQVSRAGVDLLWWTDHSDIYAPRVPDFVIVPTGPIALGPRLWSVGTWGPGNVGRAFLWSSRTPLTVSQDANRVEIVLPPG